jgi:uncharacterized protein
MKTKIFTFTFLLVSIFTFAQEITGSWQGELEVQGTKIPLIFNITEEGSNLTSTMDSPKQGAKGIPVTKTTFSNNEILLEATNLMITYKGTLQEDKIDGLFIQNKIELPLILHRVTVYDVAYVQRRPQTPKAPFDYPTEEVSFENPTDKNTLAGTISLPKDKKDFPIIVLITGSGNQDRNEEIFGHQPFAVIADDFAKKGIATLRIDDRGVGGSSKGTDNPTTANYATDINAAVEFLAKKGYKNIGLLGHSEGGMIAPMVATSNKKVKFIVSMAGPGIAIDQLMAMQIEKGGQLAGENPEKLKLDLEISKKTFEFIKSYKGNDLKSELEKMYLVAFQKYPESIMPKENIAIEAKNESEKFSNAWLLFFIKFDPADYISKLKIPVLAINGSLDFQVDAKSNLNGFEKNLKKANNKNFKIIEMSGLNHLFQKCTTGYISEYGEIEQTIAPKVLTEMSDWILTL